MKKPDQAEGMETRSRELDQHFDQLKRHYQAEGEAIAERRKKAFANTKFAADAPRAGLALSGGGVRSATFCFGLIQGLARNRLLRRFDYLSTVSGGGYIGASVSRLVSHVGIDEAEKLLADGDSQVLNWLRKNGRYLTPSGARDIGMAVATLLRSSLSTHFEFGLLATLLGVLVILPHAIQSQFGVFDYSMWSNWPSVWWPLALALWFVAAPGAILAYWPLRDPAENATQRRGERWFDFGVAFATLAGASVCVIENYVKPSKGWIGQFEISQFFLLVSLGAVGWGLYVGRRLKKLRSAGVAAEQRAFAVNQLRNTLTKALRVVNVWTFRLIVLGVIDGLSFVFVLKLQNPSWLAAIVPGVLAFGGIVVAALRSVSESAQKNATSTSTEDGRWMGVVINGLGIGIGAMLLFSWISLLQWLALFDSSANVLFHGIAPVWSVLAILLLVAAWTWITRHNREAVNVSTLHGFYRGRLVRAYLSIGNSARFKNIGKPARGVIEANSMSVVDVVEGDDVAMEQHRPEEKGGPIHLVGTTLNQTIDDHGDLFNADRKGSVAIASARGIEIGPSEASDWADNTAATLGQWVTISGAAAAPGAGSNTSLGWALLLFFFGVRLGYWKPVLLRPDDAGQNAAAAALARRKDSIRDSKSGLILSEATASFLGRPAGWWYLSDGGHFENTAVYALIKRKLPFIVLADCGADPKYLFEDIENLIRKARIDFDTEIALLSAEEARASFARLDGSLSVLTAEEVVNNHSQRGVLLARITYNSSKPVAERRFGTLLVVKPNLHEALDKDILAYARRNPTFPQQSTADQFFDEAQWESYRRLGEDFGNALAEEWLEHLPNWNSSSAPWQAAKPARHSEDSGKKATEGDSVPFWRRGAAAAAIGTTLSVSAITGVLGAAWTVYDGVNKQRQADVQEYIAAAQDEYEALLPELCRVEYVRGDVAACADRAKTEPLADLPDAAVPRLHHIYDTVTLAENRYHLTAAYDTVRDLQLACGNGDNTCHDDWHGAPVQLCGSLCTPAFEGRPNTYWGMTEKKYDWRLNLPLTRIADAFEAASNKLGLRSSPPPAPPPPAAPPPPSTPLADAPPDPRDAAAAPPLLSVNAESVRGLQTADERAPQGCPWEDLYRLDQEPVVRIATATVAAAVSDTAPAITAPKCEGGTPVTVYMQIYDEATRVVAEKARRQLKGLCNIVVTPIENVTSSAQVRGTAVPFAWKAPTLIAHLPEDDRGAVVTITSQVDPVVQAAYGDKADLQSRRLPSSINSTRHVVELWFPPTQKQSQ